MEKSGTAGSTIPAERAVLENPAPLSLPGCQSFYAYIPRPRLRGWRERLGRSSQARAITVEAERDTGATGAALGGAAGLVK